MAEEELAGEAPDPDTGRVVQAAHWHEKVRETIRSLAPTSPTCSAIGEPDHVAPDPISDRRRRRYLGNAGPRSPAAGGPKL